MDNLGLTYALLRDARASRYERHEQVLDGTAWNDEP